MSVQTEIDRIETAKTAIGTAIAGKGVTVPSGTKLDGMAALIDGIEAGGEDVSAETAEYTELLTDLETAIDALPDAGSGGGASVETCSVTLDTSNAANSDGNMAYVTVENNEIVLKTVYVPAAYIISMAYPEIVCVKGTSLVLGRSTNGSNGTSGFSVSGGVEAISYAASTLGCTFKITGDGSIAWNA